MADARAERVPLLGVLAAGAAGRLGPVNRQGLDFYQRLVDALLDARHRALADALPLGPAAGAGGRRRLARPRHRATGSPSTPRWCTRRSATGCTPGRPQRALVRGLPRVRLRRARAGPPRARGRDPGRAPPAARPRPGRAGAPRRAARVGARVNLYAVTPAGDAPEDLDAARRIDGLQNRFFLDAAAARPLPGGRARRPGAVRPRLRRGRRPGDHQRAASTCWGSTTTAASPSSGARQWRPAPAGGRAGRPASPWPGSEHVGFVNAGRPVTAMGWEIDETGLTEVLTRVARRLPAGPAVRHRERRRLRRRPGGRAGARRRAARVPRRAPARLRTRRSTPGCRWRATSPGR